MVKGILLAVAITAAAWAGATVPQLYSLVGMPGDAALKYGTIVFDPPLTMTKNAAGVMHLGLPPIKFGTGFITVTSGAQQASQVELDTAVMMYRTTPPIAPGPCKSLISDQTEGTGAFAVDASFFYACVPDPATPGGFRWGRAAFQTAW